MVSLGGAWHSEEEDEEMEQEQEEEAVAAEEEDYGMGVSFDLCRFQAGHQGFGWHMW